MKPITVTDDSFEKDILLSGKLSLIDFWAVWCGPCKAIAPIIEEIANEYDGKVLVGKVDVDENNQVAMKYGVRAIPTLIIFKGGQEVDRIMGNTQKQNIVQRIQKFF